MNKWLKNVAIFALMLFACNDTANAQFMCIRKMEEMPSSAFITKLDFDYGLYYKNGFFYIGKTHKTYYQYDYRDCKLYGLFIQLILDDKKDITPFVDELKMILDKAKQWEKICKKNKLESSLRKKIYKDAEFRIDYNGFTTPNEASYSSSILFPYVDRTPIEIEIDPEHDSPNEMYNKLKARFHQLNGIIMSFNDLERLIEKLSAIDLNYLLEKPMIEQQKTKNIYDSLR